MGLSLTKYSLGVGDRFAHQAKAQLAACVEAAKNGVEVVPVWNKSNREHMFIGSTPQQTRLAADDAVHQLHWDKPYFVDADHINLKTVENYIEPCDFFTIDVAESIGKAADPKAVQAFVGRHPELIGRLNIAGIEHAVETTEQFVTSAAEKYLAAVLEAGEIYRRIESTKGAANFISEVSMDETDTPQTPVELLVILAAIADEQIPIRTIAPKFTGRFNKGVDYEGDVEQFGIEFSDDIVAIAYAVKQYGLPADLKLSVHSGSDKFSIYQPIRVALQKFNAGLHLKTAGTTWLEELIGLAEAGGDGLDLAKEIYARAYEHRDDLCMPYAAVIDIKATELPDPSEVSRWSSEQFTGALRHDPASPLYNSSVRQLLHVGFKIAAKLGDRYLRLLESEEKIVARNVTENLFTRHIKPLFIGPVLVEK